jgi:hypothetical protein
MSNSIKQQVRGNKKIDCNIELTAGIKIRATKEKQKEFAGKRGSLPVID